MHDDFRTEPVRGLPDVLPAGEYILWQGSPLPAALAREAWGIRWVAGYFAALALWRVAVSSTTVPIGTALGHAVPFLVIGLLACGLIRGLATLQARATVYTLTNRRVVMRIGIALTLTLNLPYVQIGEASLDVRPDGHGTLAFEPLSETRLSYLKSWPHVRPRHVARPQPAFRCIPDADRVAGIFAEAAAICTSRGHRTFTTAPVAVAAE